MSTATQKAKKAKAKKPRMTDAAFLGDLQTLDVLYARASQLKKRIGLMHADLVDEFQARAIELMFISEDQKRRAELLTPKKKTIPVDAFKAACLANDIDEEETESALKPESVLIAKAKKLLDDDVLKAITQEAPGKPKIVFIDNTSQSIDPDDSDDEESED